MNATECAPNPPSFGRSSRAIRSPGLARAPVAPARVRSGLRRLGTALACALLLAAAAPAFAWDNPPQRRAQIERLLDQLAQARSAAAAQRIDQLIWQQWLRSGDVRIDGWMRQAFSARQAGDHPKALEWLNRVIETAPEYAEGWNQRATTYYEMGDDRRSLQDIAQTLARQPRHFGAISGRALIAIRARDPQTAIDNIEAAQRIHPFVGLARMLPMLRGIRNRIDGQPV